MENTCRFMHMGLDLLTIVGMDKLKTCTLQGEYYKEKSSFVVKEDGPFTMNIWVEKHRIDCTIYHVNTLLYDGVWV